MNKNTILWLIIGLLLVVGGVWYYNSTKTTAPVVNNQPVVTQPVTTTIDLPQNATPTQPVNGTTSNQPVVTNPANNAGTGTVVDMVGNKVISTAIFKDPSGAQMKFIYGQAASGKYNVQITSVKEPTTLYHLLPQTERWSNGGKYTKGGVTWEVHMNKGTLTNAGKVTNYTLLQSY